MKLEILHDRTTLAPEQPNVRDVVARICASKTSSLTESPTINIAFALDSSSSMRGDRIRLAQLAILKAIKLLRDDDRAALVTFADEASTLVGLTTVDDIGRQTLRDGIRRTQITRGTNLYAGWLHAAYELKERASAGEISRVFLLSDGQANCGRINHAKISDGVMSFSRRGVRTSVVGVGEDYDDDLLQTLSAAGYGNFYFASEPEGLTDIVTQEIAESRQIAEQDVRLEIELPAGCQVEPLGDWPITSNDRTASVTVPDLVSEQVLDVGLRVKFPPLADNERIRVGFRVQSLQTAPSNIDLVYQTGDDSNQPYDDELAAIVGNLRVHQTTRTAVRLHREGQHDQASELFEVLAQDLRAQDVQLDAFDDLLSIVDMRSQDMRHSMQEIERKALSHTSTMSVRARSRDSKPRRKDD